MQLCLHTLETPWAGHSSFAIGCFAMSSESTTCTEFMKLNGSVVNLFACTQVLPAHHVQSDDRWRVHYVQYCMATVYLIDAIYGSGGQ